MRLELVGITKAFGPLVANDHVDLTLEGGEIHCLLGENGAGKTTLMNVLFGLLHADSGEIRIDGEPVRFADPGEAVRRGIGMVHQHFMLVPVFTVAENIVLGFEPVRRLGFLDRRKARTDILRLSREFGLDVNPDALVENLPVGTQQRVEILKALMRDAQVLILDEPTAVLTPQETEGLFRVIRSLAESGRSVLFITHKLKEVLAVADRITVMRLGKVVGRTTPRESDEADLAAMMVGRTVELVVSKAVANSRLAGPRVEGRNGAGRAGADGRRPRLAHGALRRDRRPGRGPGQWADRAGRGRHWVAHRRQRFDPACRRGYDERLAASDAPGRHREHPGRPTGRRPRAFDADRRQPRPRRLQPAALRPPWRPQAIRGAGRG